mmetsp:Transcript_26742/g.61604  ORF Transcript_26742/g.61604 Transcript_26742/m.61604 type:complete len:586 (-) Transcript_26742:103-1860(-)
MIEYSAHGTWVLQKLFRLEGSVFPSSFFVAAPCALLAAVVKILIDEDLLFFLKAEDSILRETQAWSGFSFLVGFLIVFRTSQAYNRFWDGCTATHQMRAEWFDGCSALVSFAEHARTKVDDGLLDDFRGRIVRLFSMLHACALAELESINAGTEQIEEVYAFKFDVLDPAGFDSKSLATIKYSDSKVELVYSWIQTVIVENMLTGVLSIPPPILSRAFQEIANGMVAFHDAVKITYIPFPFPYAQTCDCLLVMHWIVMPLVVPQWVSHPAWAAVFVFIQVFILWALNFIATEIENPFGTDPNDIDGNNMQKDMNRHLLLLLRAEVLNTPQLQEGVACSCEDAEQGRFTMESFHEVWKKNKDCEEMEGSQSVRGPREFYQFTRAKVAPQAHGFKRRGSTLSATEKAGGNRTSLTRQGSNLWWLPGRKQSSLSLESGVSGDMLRPPLSPSPHAPPISPSAMSVSDRAEEYPDWGGSARSSIGLPTSPVAGGQLLLSPQPGAPAGSRQVLHAQPPGKLFEPRQPAQPLPPVLCPSPLGSVPNAVAEATASRTSDLGLSEKDRPLEAIEERASERRGSSETEARCLDSS